VAELRPLIQLAIRGNPGVDLEVQRALDTAGSPGTPNVATATTLVTLRGVEVTDTVTYTDFAVDLDNTYRHYRFRHNPPNQAPGAWTAWSKAKPVLMDETLPAPNSDGTLIRGDIHFIAVTPKIFIPVGGSVRLRDSGDTKDVLAATDAGIDIHGALNTDGIAIRPGSGNLVTFADATTQASAAYNKAQADARFAALGAGGGGGSGTVTKVNGKLPNGSGEVTLAPADISAATQSDVTSLQSSVSANTSAISANTTSIATKAAQSALDALSTVVGTKITQAQADVLYAAILHSHTFAAITGHPTTVSGYGITDGPKRSSATATTASVASGAYITGTVDIGTKSAQLIKCTVSAYSRIRLYGTLAALTADLDRSVGVDPAAGVSLLYDAAFDGTTGLAFNTSPTPSLYNADTTPVNTLYYTVTNTSGTTQTITLTLDINTLNSY
jgi:hypothetical protein